MEGQGPLTALTVRFFTHSRTARDSRKRLTKALVPVSRLKPNMALLASDSIMISSSSWALTLQRMSCEPACRHNLGVRKARDSGGEDRTTRSFTVGGYGLSLGQRLPLITVAGDSTAHSPLGGRLPKVSLDTKPPQASQ